jgi:amino acid transporter
MLSYNDLVYAGISNVIGAGIFLIISFVHKYAGSHTWISVLLSGLFMSIFAEHYAKLPEIIKNDKDIHLEYDIIKKISSDKIASGFIYMAIIGLIFSTYLVSRSFGNYLSEYLSFVDEKLGSLIIIGICYLLNKSGIDYVAKWNNLILLFGLGILVLLITIGFYRMFVDNDYYDFFKKSIDLKSIKNNFFNIIKGAYMIIFSYVGFELLVKLNTDTLNPQRDIPKAIRTTIMFTIIIYTLLGYVYSYAMYKKDNINVISDETINLIDTTKLLIYDTNRLEFEKDLELKNEAPLTFAMQILTKTKKINHIVSFGGMIFTATTTLLMMLSGSKLLSGQLELSTNKKIKNMNPLNIIICGVLLLYATNITIEKSTIIANVCIILLMIVVSYAVIRIRKKLL